MKKIGKLFLIPFLLFLSFSSVTTVEAEELDNRENNKFYSPEFDADVIAFTVTETGETVELTKEEYEDLNLKHETEDLINESTGPSSPVIVPMDSFRSWYKFIPTKTTNYTGDPLKVTSDINCTTSSCSIGHNVTYTKTVTVTYGNATNTEIEAIRTSLGISYSSATAKTSSFTFNLKKGEAGYIAFKPYKIKKDGYFELCTNQGGGCNKIPNKTGYVRLPKKLSNGNADGVFYFVFTKK